MASHPLTTGDAIFDDFKQRRSGIVKALTSDLKKFTQQCSRSGNNSCLYGLPDGTWKVDSTSTILPPQLPEPTIGLLDPHVSKKLLLVARHSDSWLLAMASYHAACLSPKNRIDLLSKVCKVSTVYQIVVGKQSMEDVQTDPPVIRRSKRTKIQAYGSSSSSGRASASDSSDSKICKGVRTDPPVTRSKSAKDRSVPPIIRRSKRIKIQASDSSSRRASDSSGSRRASDSSGSRRASDSSGSRRASDIRCMICDEVDAEGEEDDVFWVECDQCKMWSHIACVDLTPRSAKSKKYFFCPDCREKWKKN